MVVIFPPFKVLLALLFHCHDVIHNYCYNDVNDDHNDDDDSYYDEFVQKR